MKALKDTDILISKIKGGDRESFGKLYDLFLDRVYRFIYYRVNRREDAEDLTEQIFVKVFEGLPEYQDAGLPFEAWLFRVARNHLIDFYRTHKSHAPLDVAIETANDSASLLDQLDIKLTMENVRESLKKLPDSYREIIILKFIDDRDNEEISKILDKPVAHIRVLQNRAIKALKKIIYGQN